MPRLFSTRRISLEGCEVLGANLSSSQTSPPRELTWIQDNGPPWLIGVIVWENLARSRRAFWGTVGWGWPGGIVEVARCSRYTEGMTLGVQ